MSDIKLFRVVEGQAAELRRAASDVEKPLHPGGGSMWSQARKGSYGLEAGQGWWA